jgi:mannose-6-phosphate isomerase-like protein (cupin superfamily)
MQSTSFLAGQVTHTRLPLLPPGQPGLPLLKRLALPQGELAQIYDADEGIRYLAWIELKPGCLRGNHYHRRKAEFFYLLAGTVELTVEDLASGERAALTLTTGDLVFLRPEIVHTYRPLTPGHALEFSPVRFEPSDTFRRELVPAAA